MLEAITADEIDQDGRALAVRYQPAPEQPDLLLVSVAAHETAAESSSIRTSELRLIVIEERMTKDAMLARVQAEAAWRGIERVAWIQER